MLNRRLGLKLGGLFLGTMLLMGGEADCGGPGPDTTQKGVEAQEKTMERALAQGKVPELNNFLTRQTIIKWLKRNDQPDKEYYVYVLAPMGQYVGYYVADGRPVNICTSLTPPVREYRTAGGANPLGPAPGLDGAYYGGSGCDTWYFFDAATDALVEIKDLPLFIADQPLAVDVEQIQVAVRTTGDDAQ